MSSSSSSSTAGAGPAGAPGAGSRPAVVEGVLERITYANEESGYTVARVDTGRGGGELLTVVGALLGA
ncbi:YrrC family ATP-dependent DNA helicase, partial [Streptomyces solincola]|uniref:YrrC family ATP-dependent DNA helicase n=1 Tax=Streptomyces solincola TaxID=2100817 RepID=UPI0011B2445D